MTKQWTNGQLIRVGEPNTQNSLNPIKQDFKKKILIKTLHVQSLSFKISFSSSLTAKSPSPPSPPSPPYHTHFADPSPSSSLSRGSNLHLLLLVRPFHFFVHSIFPFSSQNPKAYLSISVSLRKKPYHTHFTDPSSSLSASFPFLLLLLCSYTPFSLSLLKP